MIFTELIETNQSSCNPLTTSDKFSVSLNTGWSMLLHHGSEGRCQNKECYLLFLYTYFLGLFCFPSKILRFYHFHFPLPWSIKFLRWSIKFLRISFTNQKQRLLISNCQWNSVKCFIEVKWRWKKLLLDFAFRGSREFYLEFYLKSDKLHHAFSKLWYQY